MVFENYSERSGSEINYNLLSYLIVQPPHQPYKYQIIREKKPDGASALTDCIVQIGALAYIIHLTPQISIFLYYLPSQFISNIAVPKFGRKKNLCDKNSISYTAAKDLKEIVRDCIGSQKKLLVYQNCLRQFSPTGFSPFFKIFSCFLKKCGQLNIWQKSAF